MALSARSECRLRVRSRYIYLSICEYEVQDQASVCDVKSENAECQWIATPDPRACEYFDELDICAWSE